MIIRKDDIKAMDREDIRGGKGKAKMYQYLVENNQRNVKFISRLELEPLTVIGEHLHDSDEELYLILEGDGTGVLDGKSFDLKAGDAFVCKMGHTHGITAGKNGLTFLAVMS